jgi:hypothetical protein
MAGDATQHNKRAKAKRRASVLLTAFVLQIKQEEVFVQLQLLSRR